MMIKVLLIMLVLVSVPSRAQDAGGQNFQDITARLDIGGDLFFVLHTGRWLEDALGRLAGGEGALPPGSVEERDRRVASEQWRQFAVRHGILGLQGLGVSSVPLQGDGSSLKIFLLRDAQEANLPFWRGFFGWQPRRLLSLDFVPSDAQFVWAATPDLAGLWQFLESARSELELTSLDQMLTRITDESLRLVQAEPLPLLQSLRHEVLLAVRRVDGPEAAGAAAWEWVVVVGSGEQDLFHVVQQFFVRSGKTLEEVMIGGYTMQRMRLPADGAHQGGQPAFAAVPGFFVWGSSARITEDALRAQRHRSGLMARPAFIDAFRGQNMVNNGLLYVSGQGTEILGRLHDRRMRDRWVQPQDSFAQQLLVELAGSGTRDAVFALTLSNWRQGVMIAGRSGMGGAALGSWLGSFPARLWLRLPDWVEQWLAE